MNKKSIFLSLILIVVLVGIGVAGYMLWPAINGAITKNKYYTSEQVQEAYDKGYGDGINNETELNAQVEYYKELTDEYYVQIVDYQNQVENFKQNAVALQKNIDSLNALKAENEKTIQGLQSTYASSQSKIEELNSTISGLNAKKAELEQQLRNSEISISNYEQQVAVLNSQIEASQSLVDQLTLSNAANLELINSLNSQIFSLNTQISELNFQIQNNSVVVSSLNKKISELEKSIEYYESYVKTLESGDKVVVTFEFDGSVINVQVVSKGVKVSIVDPQSTDYVIFNYWTVNGGKIDLSDYIVSESVKIVANVTYKYDVKFMVDSSEYNKQVVEKDHFAVTPSVPSKAGYVFDGWTVSGNDIVDVSKYKITGPTIFTAKFSKLHTVTFMYESETKSIQSVRNGEYASKVEVDSTDYKVFNGWTVNGTRVDVSSYRITADTVFVADITYKYDVKFLVDEQEHNKQIVAKDGYASVPPVPSKDGFEFDGWTVNGNDIVDVSKYKITGVTTFIAKFTKLHTVKFINGSDEWSTVLVRHGGFATLSNHPDKANYSFVGWSIDGENVIDIFSYSITDDTIFYAVFSNSGGNHQTPEPERGQGK